MDLVFTKCSGKYDRLEVKRPGGPVEVVDCPKQRIIPHDMVHYAVERTLGVRGFLRRVNDGEPASLQMKGEDQSDAVERLVEVFQGDEWSGGTTAPAEMIDLYRLTCSARSCSMLPVDESAIVEVRALIASLTRDWLALPVGQALRLAL